MIGKKIQSCENALFGKRLGAKFCSSTRLGSTIILVLERASRNQLRLPARLLRELLQLFLGLRVTGMLLEKFMKNCARFLSLALNGI